jgi:hypothetical protein
MNDDILSDSGHEHGFALHGHMEHPDHGHHDPDDDGHETPFAAPSYVEVGGWGPTVLGENFDPAQYSADGVIGNPEEDLQNWHQQTHSDSCAIVAQEFILDDLLGHHFTEDQLCHEAMDAGLYTPGSGTTLDALGGLLEMHGIHVQTEYGATLAQIEQQLAEGHKVIAAVDADKIWYPDQEGNNVLANAGGFPGSDANHAVQVIGYDPQTQMVILNDPGTPDGRGLMVPADRFLDAWGDGGDVMMHTTGQATAAGALPQPAAAANMHLGAWEMGSSGYSYYIDPDGHYTGRWSS